MIKNIILWIGFVLLIMFASITRGDLYVYDLEATLTENNVTYVDQEPF